MQSVFPIFFVLATKRQLLESPNSKILIIDGAFYCYPGDYYQIIIFLIQVYDVKKYICVMHIVMDSKTHEDYKTVINIAKNLMNGANFNTIISDIESGLKRAIGEIFPNSIQKGCYFHYCNCIKRKFKKLYGDNNEIKDIKKIFLNLPFLNDSEINIFGKKISFFQK